MSSTSLVMLASALGFSGELTGFRGSAPDGIAAASPTGSSEQIAQVEDGAAPTPLPQDQPEAAIPEAATGTAANAIALQAREWGVGQCRDGIDALSSFLTAGTEFSVRSSGGTEADREMFTATIAGRDPGQDLASFSYMTAAPVTGGGCDLSYVAVTHFPDECEAVRLSRYGDFSQSAAFGDVATLFRAPANGAFLYMLATGDGCMVMKQQIIY